MLTRYTFVTRKLKTDDEQLGPVDVVRLVVDGNGNCKCLVYDTLVLSVAFFHECAPMLEKMNDFSQTACPGIKNYSLYKGSIGYDIKRVKLCNWPTDTVRDVDCCLWYEKDEMKKCNLCEKCMYLKWKLDKSCKRHNATSPATKRKRQEASSKYSFVYLSPASQKMKTKKLTKSSCLHPTCCY